MNSIERNKLIQKAQDFLTANVQPETLETLSVMGAPPAALDRGRAVLQTYEAEKLALIQARNFYTVLKEEKEAGEKKVIMQINALKTFSRSHFYNSPRTLTILGLATRFQTVTKPAAPDSDEAQPGEPSTVKVAKPRSQQEDTVIAGWRLMLRGIRDLSPKDLAVFQEFGFTEEALAKIETDITGLVEAATLTAEAKALKMAQQQKWKRAERAVFCWIFTMRGILRSASAKNRMEDPSEILKVLSL